MNAFTVALATLSVGAALIASVAIFNPYAKSSGTASSQGTPAMLAQNNATIPAQSAPIVASALTPEVSPTVASPVAASPVVANPAAVPTASVQQSITVDQAYQRIPHSKTTFSLAQSQGMSAAESQGANELFTWVDFAVVERVTMMDTLQHGQQYSAKNYDVILEKINSIAVPETLAEPKSLISVAINDQKRYFEQLSRTGQSQSANAQDPLIQSAHQKLFAAYNRLISLYPQASDYNKKAFFDHLCALDFV